MPRHVCDHCPESARLAEAKADLKGPRAQVRAFGAHTRDLVAFENHLKGLPDPQPFVAWLALKGMRVAIEGEQTALGASPKTLSAYFSGIEGRITETQRVVKEVQQTTLCGGAMPYSEFVERYGALGIAISQEQSVSTVYGLPEAIPEGQLVCPAYMVRTLQQALFLKYAAEWPLDRLTSDQPQMPQAPTDPTDTEQ